MVRARREDASTTPADPAERAREIALRSLNHAPRSAAQLREKLISRDVTPELADEIIERYRDVGLIDDAALAASIVRTRRAERGLAPRAIRMELARKGFEPALIEDVLADWDGSIDPRALELARRKWDASDGVDEEARTRRVVSLLARKGYSPSAAFSVVKEWKHADKAGVDYS